MVIGHHTQHLLGQSCKKCFKRGRKILHLLFKARLLQYLRNPSQVVHVIELSCRFQILNDDSWNKVVQL